MTAQRTPHTPFGTLGALLQSCSVWAVAIGALSFAVEAAAQGQPPTIEAPVPDQQLEVGYEPYRIHLEDYFGGRHVECIARSSDESVARVYLQGLRVRVVPVGAGTATITVGAVNEAGSAEQTFEVTVTYPAPRVGGPLPDAEVRVTQSIGIDVTDAFTGLVEEVTATVSPDGHATAMVERSLPREGPWQTRLTLMGVAHGPVTVTLAASNAAGTTERTFGLMVRDIPPAVGAMLEDTTVRVTESLTVDLADAFTGTALQYSAEVAPDSGASASIDGTTLTLTGMVAGPTTVTVTATNAEGSANQMFALAVRDIPVEVAEMIAPTTVRVTEYVMVDLTNAFSGTGISYTASVSPETAASASVDGATLTLTGLLATPDATVMVTATNTENAMSQSFMLSVRDIPPAVGEMIEATTVRVTEYTMVDLESAFTGTALSYTATVSPEASATAMVDGTTLTLTGLVAGDATVTVTASNAEGSVPQSFMLTVEDIPPMVAEMLSDIELRVGDTMDVDLSGAFSGTALQYSAMSSSDAMARVSVEGASLTVTAVAAGGVSVTVIAMNTADSAQQAFAVNVRDVPPATTAGIPDVHLVAGGAPAVIDLDGHFSGSALVFGASVSDVAVTATVAGAQLTVTPANEGAATVTVTASNTEGMISVNFNAMVTTDAAEVEAIERGLAAIAGATLSSVNSAFHARFSGSSRGASSAAPLALDGAPGEYFGPFGGLASAGAGTEWNGGGWNSGWSSGQWNGSGMSGSGWNGSPNGYGTGPGLFGPSRPMSGGSFIMPLAASGGGAGMGEWSIWGHADWQSFEGEGLDGDLTSVYIGTDVEIGEEWLVGVAASQSDGDVDYRFAGQAASGTGSLATEMLSIFPYANYSVDDCTELWAILGFGSGDIESRRSVVTRTSEADLTMSLVSAGGSRVISSGEGWSITFLGDASAINMDTDGITGAISSVEVDVRRIRAGFQGARTIEMDDGTRLVLFGEVAARNDSGDGDTGGGAEVSAGIRFNTTDRFSVELKGRVLATHSEDDVEESAFSLSAMLLPKSNGGGLSLALSSRQGADFGLSGIMPGRDYDAMRRARGIADDWGLDARIGYGMPDTGLPGLLTPFVKIDAGSSYRRGARVGARFDAGGRLVRNLTIEAAAGTTYSFFEDSMAGLVELRGELRF